MPVQLGGGGKVAEPKDLAATDKDRPSSKKNRRRQKKPATSAAISPPVAAMQTLFDTSREVFQDSLPGFVPPPQAVARLAALLSTYFTPSYILLLLLRALSTCMPLFSLSTVPATMPLIFANWRQYTRQVADVVGGIIL
jgi:hypothetical protein